MDTSELQQLFLKLQDDFKILVSNMEKSNVESVFVQNVKSTCQEYDRLCSKFQDHEKEYEKVHDKKIHLLEILINTESYTYIPVFLC